MAEQLTVLLKRWSDGDGAALDQLMPMVYDELRKLGRSYLQSRSQQAVLQPTVLVHEAWLRLADKENLTLSNRSQFYALAAKIMRDILVDHFRRQTASKRGGSQIHVPLEDSSAASGQNFDLVILNDAVNRLGEIKPRYAEIVELRFFAGLTTEESAEVLHVSTATIEREWRFARSWLRRELGGPDTENG